VLIRVQATRGAARYEFASASRTRRHLVCTRCGRDLIVPATAFDDLRATMLDRYGFQLHPVQGALPGVCHHCETS
jgi:Fe2+ or Zn2+ uptake regulation protein